MSETKYPESLTYHFFLGTKYKTPTILLTQTFEFIERNVLKNDFMFNPYVEGSSKTILPNDFSNKDLEYFRETMSWLFSDFHRGNEINLFFSFLDVLLRKCYLYYMFRVERDEEFFNRIKEIEGKSSVVRKMDYLFFSWQIFKMVSTKEFFW